MKTVLIGLGMVAPIYAKALDDLPDIALHGIHSRDPAKRAAFRQAHAPQAKEYESIAEIAADPEVDFVLLATPPNARAEIVDTLAGAGKPILMEKPIERTLAAADALVARCENAGVPLGVMLQHRARPVVADLRRVMADLGPLHAVEISIPWWRPQSYYDEPGRGSYARDGGGVMISQAIHTMDLALSLTGPVAEVTAMTATTGLHRMEAEDWVTCGLRFANGAVGTLFATTAAYPGRGEAIRLYHGRAAVTLEANELRIDRLDGTSQTIGASASSGSGADPMAFTHEWHRDVIADFAAALRDRRPPMVTGRDALAVHRLIAAIETSARDGTRKMLA